MRDLNILIGPNNCGKTNILELLSLFSKIHCGEVYPYLCEECNKFREKISGITLSLQPEDFRLRRDPTKTKVSVKFSLNHDAINKLFPGILRKQKEKLKEVSCKNVKAQIEMETMETDYNLYGKHISPFIDKNIIEKLNRYIRYCPERRLQKYWNKGFAEYIRQKVVRGTQWRSLIEFLKIIDPKIVDEKGHENLIMKINGEDFEASILEQGSGVRSLICLAADILFSDAKIVLVDEPELGLNPFVEQEFLKFLLAECESKQIFIATHSPTFVNPILWKNEKVSIYFYSPIIENFKRINLKENKEDPEVFAGYLPHTTTLKDIQIYVEGTSDVYIFQIWLEKFLRKEMPENWFEILNKVGIFHLGGDNWHHLLYTIPKPPPYNCIIILDGNKRRDAVSICEKYNKLMINASKFKFCEDINEVGKTLCSKKEHAVYCLKENCIEKYIIPDFDCKNPPRNYNKRTDGPKKADKIDEVPNEIKQLFQEIFRSLGLGRIRKIYTGNKSFGKNTC